MRLRSRWRIRGALVWLLVAWPLTVRAQAKRFTGTFVRTAPGTVEYFDLVVTGTALSGVYTAVQEDGLATDGVRTHSSDIGGTVEGATAAVRNGTGFLSSPIGAATATRDGFILRVTRRDGTLAAARFVRSSATAVNRAVLELRRTAGVIHARQEVAASRTHARQDFSTARDLLARLEAERPKFLADSVEASRELDSLRSVLTATRDSVQTARRRAERARRSARATGDAQVEAEAGRREIAVGIMEVHAGAVENRIRAAESRLAVAIDHLRDNSASMARVWARIRADSLACCR